MDFTTVDFSTQRSGLLEQMLVRAKRCQVDSSAEDQDVHLGQTEFRCQLQQVFMTPVMDPSSHAPPDRFPESVLKSLRPLHSGEVGVSGQ